MLEDDPSIRINPNSGNPRSLSLITSTDSSNTSSSPIHGDLNIGTEHTSPVSASSLNALPSSSSLGTVVVVDEKAELGKTFQQAVSAHQWGVADSLIPLADRQRLNDGLCIVLDSVWFLTTDHDISFATQLMEKLVRFGADDFSRAALRTSFLASCVSACRSRSMSLADTVTIMGQR